MAGEYGVNIKFRTIGLSQLDKAKAKARELEASVSKIRSLDLSKAIRGKVGDRVAEATGQIKRYAQQVNKTGKVIGQTQQQQEAALEAFKNLRSQVKVGGRDFDLLTEAIIRQNKAIDEQNKKLGINQKKRKADPRGRSAALKSGLISGAFPLLFGQGPLGGAAGFAGGFIGTRIGGQMGGFAGGLVATAVLQQITILVNNINQLGNAFNELEPNIDKLTVSLGLAGTMEQKRLQIIARSEGAHVALAMATEQMNKAIGEKGVRNLQEFAESSRLLGNSFTLAMTKMQAALAPFFKVLANIGGGITGANQKERQRLLGLGEAEGGSDAARLTILREQLAGMPSTKQNRAKRKRIEAQIGEIEERLIKEGKSIDLANTRQLLFEEATKSIEEQNTFLQNQLLLGQQGAEIEREKARVAKKMKIDVKDLTKEQIKQIENNIKIRDELQKLNTLYSSITSTVETGLVDAIEGAINGTKTLGDVARSVFTQIQRSLIQFGVNAFLGGLQGIGQFFRANGGPVSTGKSYMVGERGPEMFVPNTGGRIVPNSDMGSSTNVVVNVDASGSAVEGDEEQGRELGRLISVAVQSEIIQQQRPGGLLA